MADHEERIMGPMPNMNERSPWLASVLQTVDPLFPIGSYAHSYSLEEIVALGIVEDEATLTRFLLDFLAPAIEQFELPYLRFLYEAILGDDFIDVSSLDSQLNASYPSIELRQAHASQGRQRLKLLRKLKPSPVFELLDVRREEGSLIPMHHTVYAAEKGAAKVPLEATLISWAYQSFAAAATASLKLIRIGQEGAQRSLTTALEQIPHLLETSLTVERDRAGCFNPLVDIASNRHQKAYSRLFIS